ncbi:helix-turn-helix transcriptional regulator [Streptomyces sp. WMMC500]|uniref:helix-turn-helix domain-containing protein n=1 Tax=Streptomyces sp. WMMC500 TaxID=3015154 RepID=UPI00248AE563|nr:helix-turn-helix transcriptional regulator [Streptomyces sp. WMMC500]WBB63992.1 helix-turn-helix transcriptional regulator [Streptomyces sp. WMMC500]
MTPRNATHRATGTTAEMFGDVLRHLREAAGMTQAELAKQIPCDRSYVARIETGTSVPPDTFAAKCDEVLGGNGLLARLWLKVDWYPDVAHPDWFERRAQMDAECTALRAYQERMMPGLLQTEAYTHAQFAQVIYDEETLDERVRARLSRQQRFFSSEGPLYVVVLDESCLRNVVGGSEIMREQCEHLLSAGQRTNIQIQVTPAERPEIIRPNTSMSLITLPDGHEWVYSESLDHGHFVDNPTVYQQHLRTYDVLRADALSARDSAALIGKFMEGYGQHGHDVA